MNETEIQIYEVPNWNLSILKTEIKKINKRANKIGCPELKITEHGITHRVHPSDAEKIAHGIKYLDDCVKIKYHKISIEGEPPKFAGWTFLGTLDHWTIDGAVLVKTVPSHTIPKQYYEATPECGHCNKIRRRKDTFVLQNESGEYKQVGRMCLKDFLGHDPSRIALHLTRIFELVDELESDYYGGGGGHIVYSYDLERVLALTTAIIRTCSWVARSAAKKVGTTSTAEHVMSILNPPKTPDRSYKAFRKEVYENHDTEKDVNEAKKAITWVEDQETTNEYMHNIKAIAKAGVVNWKTVGYACSIIAAYQRAEERLRLKEIERKTRKNEWVGTEKERLEITVKVTGVQYIDGYYGTTTLHKMVDEKGRTIVWFASGSKKNDLEAGKKYRITATIKKHDEYNDWKQTIVNRAKIVEEIQ